MPRALTVSRLAGPALGLALDAFLGDPSRWHPVAGFGSAAGRLERRVYAPRRSRGVLHTALCVIPVAGLGLALDRGGAVRRTAVLGMATWGCVGGRSLGREADAVGALLRGDDLAGARRRIRSLVGRDTSRLDADGLARAAVESVAENGSDAVAAPVLWAVALGPAGVLGHRAVNTLDAMVGHRNERYTEFGWCAARLDDLLNHLPARLAVASTVVVVAARDRSLHSGRRVIGTVRRDAPAHPSPNAGPVEAAYAAALGVQLGGSNVYDGHVEDRGVLGDGDPAGVGDLPGATSLLRRVSWTCLALACAGRLLAQSVVSAPAWPGHRRR